MHRIFAALIAALLSAAAAAQDALTRDEVERYVSALEEMAAASERHDKLSASQPQAAAQDMYDSAREIAEDHGFTQQEWSRVSRRVFDALLALEADTEQMRKDLAETRSEIENNPNLSEKQKKKMLKALEQQSNAVDEAAHSPDQQAVRPYKDRLMALTEDRGASE